MHLVFGGSRSTVTADVEELLVQCIRAEHAAVVEVLGAKYCLGIGQVGEDGRNHRPVRILDPYLDVAVTHACRREWCRLFEKVSLLFSLFSLLFLVMFATLLSWPTTT
jgi:hypothetical protein